MMDGEDGGPSRNNASSAGRFVFPTYERPMELQEINDALNVANIEVKDGALVDMRRNEGITEVLIKHPHPGTTDSLPGSERNASILLIINADKGNLRGTMKSFGNNLGTEAAGASAAEAATKPGGAVKQALSKLNLNKGSKRVAIVGTAAVTAILTVGNLAEDLYEKTQKPNSFYNKVVKPTPEETVSKPKPSDTK